MSDRGDRSVTGIVTDVQHFSIHDGPGIRTTVFLKGCNLRCFWCHNPETLAMKSELQYFPERCIACGACVTVCPTRAHAVVDGVHEFDRSLCTACGACAATCYARALVMAGETRTADDIVAEVARDRTFYETSGGGVTISGGEPLLQPNFTEAVLAGCLEHGISTAIETAANVPWDTIARVLPVTRLVMMDIKSADSERHRSATGVPNERILANARRIAEYGVPIIVRTPVVPGVNDDEASIASIAAFLAELPGDVTYELLRFHMMAEAKYAALGLTCRAAGTEPPTLETMERLTRVAEDAGVAVRSA